MAQQPAERELPHPGGPRPGEGEEVLEHPLEVVGLAADLGEEVGDRVLVRPPLDQREIAAQGRQAVAQLVGDAAGHLAELGQALGEAALLAAPLHLGQVGEEHEQAAHLAVIAAQGVDGEAHGQRLRGLAARAHGALLALRGGPLGHGGGEDLAQLGLARQHLGERRSRLGEPGAEQRRAHSVERQHPPLAVDQQQAALQARRERPLDVARA